jgi:hypothetical protein
MQIPSASLGMTKGRSAFPMWIGCADPGLKRETWGTLRLFPEVFICLDVKTYLRG